MCSQNTSTWPSEPDGEADIRNWFHRPYRRPSSGVSGFGLGFSYGAPRTFFHWLSRILLSVLGEAATLDKGDLRDVHRGVARAGNYLMKIDTHKHGV